MGLGSAFYGNLKKKFGSVCSKKFCVQAKGGGGIAQCPPKYATGWTTQKIHD